MEKPRKQCLYVGMTISKYLQNIKRYFMIHKFWKIPLNSNRKKPKNINMLRGKICYFQVNVEEKRVSVISRYWTEMENTLFSKWITEIAKVLLFFRLAFSQIAVMTAILDVYIRKAIFTITSCTQNYFHYGRLVNNFPNSIK